MKEVSVLLPCLNEEQAIGQSIKSIQKVFRQNNINGEIIVIDNGSTDNTASIAKQYPVTYILQPERGYGNAYLSGLNQAQGEFLIMGDPDSTYDFNEIPNFLIQLKEKQNDFVLGSRYLGNMQPGAMPFTHKYIGNPIIRFFLRLNNVKTRETSTGFVGIKRPALNKLQLKQPGMEFSSELLVQASNNNLQITEIPINYNQRLGKSKIREIPDGLRHVGFLMKSYFSG